MPQHLGTVEIRIRKMDDGNIVVDVKENTRGRPSSIETLYTSRVEIDIEKGLPGLRGVDGRVAIFEGE